MNTQHTHYIAWPSRATTSHKTYELTNQAKKFAYDCLMIFVTIFPSNSNIYRAMTTHYNTIIIGAGAAGMMCAIEAAKRGRSVLLLDHANKAGKKILMSGGGRCNFTNISVSDDNFISHNPHFCKSALSRYTPQHFIEQVKKSGIAYHEKTLGQLFCDNKSKDIVNMLLASIDKYHVQLQLNTNITSVCKTKQEKFIVSTCRGTYCSDSLVTATGGLSIPTMGASAFGYRLANQFNIPVFPTRAGLVPFTLHQQDKDHLAPLSGVSIYGEVECNNTYFKENLLFTHRGLSGPAILQISSYWKPGETVSINCLPGLSLQELITEDKQTSGNVSVKTYLSQHLPKRLLPIWFNSRILTKTLANLNQEEIELLTSQIHQWKIKPNNTEGYRTAEVTIGGVDTNYISSKTFEASNCNGLYFIGEVLDVTGWLGGYNFQWAWASGYCAGQYV